VSIRLLGDRCLVKAAEEEEPDKPRAAEGGVFGAVAGDPTVT
jgi:hypothetical protein